MEHLWNGDDLLLVDGLGYFVRCLIEARCSQRHQVAFNPWAVLDDEDAQCVIDRWWGPGYASLTMPARLANKLPYWDLLDAPVLLAVRDAQQYPFVDTSADPRVVKVLGQRWPHSEAG